MNTARIQHFFPDFEPNQVLTSSNLNHLRNYLDEQRRYGLIRTVGTGIVCGLYWSHTTEGLTVFAGYGLCSDGWLIELADTTFTHVHDYIDPVVDEEGTPIYEPWRRPGEEIGQLPIRELLSGETMAGEEAPSDATLFADEELGDRVLVLYLELDEVDLHSCLVTDCDNRGANIHLKVRALLVDERELERVQEYARPLALLRLPRIHAGLRAYDETPDDLTGVTDRDEINFTYGRIALDRRDAVIDVIERAVDTYGRFLDIDATEAASAAARLLTILDSSEADRFNQYHFDFIRDLAHACNEFAEEACRLITPCLPLSDFPRHLMLGALDGTDRYRNEFTPSPVRNVMEGAKERVAALLRRIFVMIESFELPKVQRIRLTPSHTELYPLGERAVPYYYEFNGGIQDLWRPKECCSPAPLHSYYRTALDEAVGEYGEHPLNYDYGGFSFLRIEGHLGLVCTEAKTEIAALRAEHNLDFDLICLHLKDDRQDEATFAEQIDVLVKKIADLTEKLQQLMAAPDPNEEAVEKVLKEIDKHKKHLLALRMEWGRLRTGRRPLCDIEALRADYFAIRSEVLCVLNAFTAGVVDLFGEKERTMTVGKERVEERLTEIREAIDRSGTGEESRETLRREEELFLLKKTFIDNEDRLRAAARTILGRSIVVDTVSMVGPSRTPRLPQPGVTEAIDDPMQLFMAAIRASVGALEQNVRELSGFYLSKDFLTFNLSLFLWKYREIVELATRLRLAIVYVLETLMARIDEEKAQEVVQLIRKLNSPELFDTLAGLLRLIRSCAHTRLSAVYHMLEHIRAEDLAVFSRFAARYNGMEHLAGVGKGGTFILVCDRADEANASSEADVVVADFALAGKIPCCCPIRPQDICLPPVPLVDYRVVRIKVDDGEPRPIILELDLLGNDLALNLDEGTPLLPGVSHLSLTLPSVTSELGGKLEVREDGTVVYRHDNPPMLAIDAFSYTVIDRRCSMEAPGRVVLLLMPVVTPKAVRTGIVTGTVITPDRSHVPGAEIRLTNTDFVTKSGQEGAFTFEEVPEGSYQIRVTFAGFAPYGNTVLIASGQTTTHDVNLAAVTSRVVITVREREKREAVPFALVIVEGKTFEGSDLVQEVNADQNGIATLEAMLPGTYMARVRHVTGTAPNRVTFSGTVDLRVQNQPVTSVELLAAMSFESGRVIVAGKVLTAEGEPMEGVTVRLIDASTNVSLATETDITGSYRFDDIQPATYRFEANDGEVSLDRRELKIVAEDDDVMKLDPVLAPKKTGGIGGVVVDPNGAAVPGAQIVLADTSRTTVSGPDGRFAFTTLAPGTHSLRVSAQGFGTTSVQADVTAGTTRSVTVRLEQSSDTPSIGTVVGSTTFMPQPSGDLPLVVVTVVEQERSVEARNGKVSIELSPGIYSLHFSAEGYAAAPLTVTVVAGESTKVRATMFRHTPTPPDPTERFTEVVVRRLTESGVTPSDARRRVESVVKERGAERMALLEELGETGIKDTVAFANAVEFVTRTVHRDDLDESTVADEFEGVTSALATNFQRGTGERKEGYAGTAALVLHAWLDRIALRNPESVDDETSRRLSESIGMMKENGLKPAALRREWKPETMSNALNVESVEGLARLIR